MNCQQVEGGRLNVVQVLGFLKVLYVSLSKDNQNMVVIWEVFIKFFLMTKLNCISDWTGPLNYL